MALTAFSCMSGSTWEYVSIVMEICRVPLASPALSWNESL